MNFGTNTAQAYPNYTYYPQPFPQTPHHNVAALRPVPNGYQQYYQQAQAHPVQIPGVSYDQYPAPYTHATVGQSMERPTKTHRRNNTVPLKSAMKQPSNSAPGSTNDHGNNLARQRTNSTGHNMLGRTRTQSNPRAPDLTAGKEYNFVPGINTFISGLPWL